MVRMYGLGERQEAKDVCRDEAKTTIPKHLHSDVTRQHESVSWGRLVTGGLNNRAPREAKGKGAKTSLSPTILQHSFREMGGVRADSACLLTPCNRVRR